MAVVVRPASPPTAAGRCSARRRRFGGRGVLARFPAHPQAARPVRRRLVISNQHAGLVAALAACSKASASTLPGPLRPQPVGVGAEVAQGHGRCCLPHDLRPTQTRSRRGTWDTVRDQLATGFPKIGPLMDDAKTECWPSPPSPPHWPKCGRPTRSRSTRRSNAGPRRRHLPQRGRRHPPVGAPGRHPRRWQVSDRRYLSEGSMAKIKPTAILEPSPQSQPATGIEDHLESPPPTRHASLAIRPLSAEFTCCAIVSRAPGRVRSLSYMAPWRSWLARRPVTAEVAGSSPVGVA